MIRPLVYLTFLSAVILMVGCAAKAPGSDFTPTPWTESEEHLAEQEQYKVGPLPEDDLTLLRYLAHYNKRVEEEKLPFITRVTLYAPPETLLKPPAIWPIEKTLQMEPSIFNDIIDYSKPIRPQLEQLNLRQFLWIAYRANLLGVSYSNVGIKLTYGMATHQYMAPHKYE
jgi:hypothetical protein